ncbi:hypothetical protein [Dyella sp. S184]|uniref:hypothetical protein n=1 Tax=Dyella sp. S184 TaxID=1641862 RepID=UPI00131A9D5D|nr:hypothetical protein [Dyella sp. S184]
MEDFHYVDEDQIEEDLEAAPKPPVLEVSLGYPLYQLTDRQFECLMQDVFRREMSSAAGNYGQYDNVLLMQGVGERGRDAVLTLGGTHVGVIQCKKYSSLLTKPDAAREIIKFCLHVVLDPRLAPQPAGFKYIFAVSNDFNERAKSLLSNFGIAIALEAELKAWVTEVIAENRRMKTLDVEQVLPRLLGILQAIEVIALGFNEINTLVADKSVILTKYFTLRAVVSEEKVDRLIEKVTQHLTAISDEDVKRVSDRLALHKPDRRVDMGLMSLWGYPTEFVADLFKTAKFRELSLALAKAKADLDNKFLAFLNAKVDDEILAKITALRKFSPLIIQAAKPYILGVLMQRWMQSLQGELVSIMLAQKTSIKTDIWSIRTHLLEAGENYLKGDFSKVVGDVSLLALKKQVFRYTYSRYANRHAMEQAFDAEWPSVLPVADGIVRDLDKLIPDDPSIILRGNKWFDDPEHMKRVFENMSQFNS